MQMGIAVTMSCTCKAFKRMGCTRQAIHHVALQQSDVERARFMADISLYEPSMLVFIDETGCDRHNTIHKYGYNFRAMPVHDKCLLVRSVRYSAIPVMSMSGILDICLIEGTVNGDTFADFIDKCLFPYGHKSHICGSDGQCQHSPCGQNQVAH